MLPLQLTTSFQMSFWSCVKCFSARSLACGLPNLFHIVVTMVTQGAEPFDISNSKCSISMVLFLLPGTLVSVIGHR
ncbi:hypothetical protein BJ165DRAFT_1447824 [Panaeolus papilionaceus]|nr:hypothetical protein BJ165DRAFT_1447824 [Panaeolus papilionaceus]